MYGMPRFQQGRKWGVHAMYAVGFNHSVADQVRRIGLSLMPNAPKLDAANMMPLAVTRAHGDGGNMENGDTRHDINSGIVSERILAIAQGSEAKILVVDDDELTLALISDLLQSGGFEVRQASDGARALKLLEHEWFPVIITDWQMPVMSGLELTRGLRARGVLDTYVIMLTALESGADYESAYEAGVDDYLTKKLPDIELFSRIHAAYRTLYLRRSLQEARTALAKQSTN
jgi:CheY-like chemotaxis protein